MPLILLPVPPKSQDGKQAEAFPIYRELGMEPGPLSHIHGMSQRSVSIIVYWGNRLP